jgi:hypothetical protein
MTPALYAPEQTLLFRPDKGSANAGAGLVVYTEPARDSIAPLRDVQLNSPDD